ncbi:MAG: hypothetical protein HKN07_00950 [Acidimicrobiia bacterium]|nr:septum formation family protein [Acidimicrobiia bacterium]NNF62800.1 hypothetical protein [Acidimicrobiia bacterium]
MDKKPLSSEELLRRARETFASSEEMTHESDPEPRQDATSDDAGFHDEPIDYSLLREDDPIPLSPSSLDHTEPDDDETAAYETPPSEWDLQSAEGVERSRADRLGLNLPGRDADPFGTQTSPPPPVPMPPSSAKSRSGSRFRWIWIVGLIAFGLGRAFFNSGVADVAELSPGDCLPELGFEEISDVRLIDCADPHSLEVYSVVQVGAPSDAFPGEDALSDTTFNACLAQFEGYVGVPYENSELWIYTLSPVREGWEDFNDRESICLLYASPDDGFSVMEQTGTFRNSQR